MKEKMKNNLRFVSCLIPFLMLLAGCFGGNNTSDLPDIEDIADMSPISSTVGNFEDIELPADMKFIYKDSVSIRTESFRGGIIHYKGRIEAYSLKEFIVAAMQKNKWKLAGEVSGHSIILAFTKPNRTCMMKIEPNSSLLDTELTMFVTVDLVAGRSLNAFGEPIN